VLAALDPSLFEDISVPDSLHVFISKFMDDNKSGPSPNCDQFEKALFKSSSSGKYSYWSFNQPFYIVVAMEGGVNYTQ
jgi:hypothetical protein